jgi:succinate dehydrogenase / fumarate reductase cytochrome b subunit
VTRFFAFLETSVGKKVVMAVSGLILVGFVIVHMLGNLQVYLGPTKLDEYGEALRRVPAALWGLRTILLLATVAHIWAAWAVSRQSWAARPVGYRDWQPAGAASTYASRTMRWSGVLLLLFIVYHLMHFTWGNAHPDFVPGAVHHNFVVGFRQTAVSAFYVVAMMCLGLHLYHGVWSFLQTLGLSHARYNHLRHTLAAVVAVVVVAGNISFPLAVLAGLVKEAPRAARIEQPATASAPGGAR